MHLPANADAARSHLDNSRWAGGREETDGPGEGARSRAKKRPGARLRGFLSRMKVYLGEMFPLPRRAATAALMAASFAVCVARAHEVGMERLWRHTLVACWSLFGLMLIISLIVFIMMVL